MLHLCEDIMICNSSSYKNQAEILLLQSNQEFAPAKGHHNAISEEVITQNMLRDRGCCPVKRS